MKCIKCGVESAGVLCAKCISQQQQNTDKKPRGLAANCLQCELFKNHTCTVTSDYISNPGRKNC